MNTIDILALGPCFQFNSQFVMLADAQVLLDINVPTAFVFKVKANKKCRIRTNICFCVESKGLQDQKVLRLFGSYPGKPDLNIINNGIAFEYINFGIHEALIVDENDFWTQSNEYTLNGGDTYLEAWLPDILNPLPDYLLRAWAGSVELVWEE